MIEEKIEHKFWSKVKKTKECWIFIGGKTSTGYGDFRWGNKNRMKAHRMSWKLFNGMNPKKWILHKCDNPICVNPSHLFEGTAKDNSQDCVKKGRHSSSIRTHCPHGHEYTKENTYIHINGSRRCKKCSHIYFKNKKELED